MADPSYRGTRLANFPADEVILMVEVVSESNPENDTDRKVRKYAEAGIPHYLVVDPIRGVCMLHSGPVSGKYQESRETAFGVPVSVGAPIDDVIDTTALFVY